MMRIVMVGLLAFSAGALAQPQGRGGPSNWRFVGAEAGRPGMVVKSAPFSADVTTETSMVLQDGNHIRQTSSVRMYRDGEGRTRREQSLSNVGGLTTNLKMPPVVFIDDPVAGMSYALDASAKTANRSAVGPRGPAGNRGMRSGPRPSMPMGPPRNGQSNVKTEALGRQTVEGVLAEGSRTTMTIPAGQVGNEQPIQTVVETWYSPDLQVVVLSKRSDPRTGDTVTRYTNIVRTEPARNLFEVPADYKISDAPARPADANKR